MGQKRKPASGISGVDLKIIVIDEENKDVKVDVFTPKFRQDRTPDAMTGKMLMKSLKEHKNGKRVIIEPVDSLEIRCKKASLLVEKYPYYAE